MMKMMIMLSEKYNEDNCDVDGTYVATEDVVLSFYELQNICDSLRKPFKHSRQQNTNIFSWILNKSCKTPDILLLAMIMMMMMMMMIMMMTMMMMMLVTTY